MTNKFMVGNWVNEPFPMQVVSVFQDEIYCNFEGNEGDVFEFKNEDVKPIEITPDNLPKLGFKKNRVPHYKNYVITIDGEKFSVKYDDGEWHFSNDESDADCYVLKSVKKMYVHWLQNLIFILTNGHELIYKP